MKAAKNKSVPMLAGIILVAIIVFAVMNSSPKVKDYEVGQWNGNVFSSSFLELQFTLPDGWTAADDAELQQLMDEAVEQLRTTDESLAERYENGELNNPYELVIHEDNGTGWGMVQAQNISISASSYLSSLQDQYAEQGIEVTEMDAWTVGGFTYEGIRMTQDGKVQDTYAVYDEGYLVTITLYGDSEEKVDMLKGQFGAIADGE